MKNGNTTVTFEVTENPNPDVLLKYHENGDLEMIFQMTQQQMDEFTEQLHDAITQNRKNRAK